MQTRKAIIVMLLMAGGHLAAQRADRTREVAISATAMHHFGGRLKPRQAPGIGFFVRCHWKHGLSFRVQGTYSARRNPSDDPRINPNGQVWGLQMARYRQVLLGAGAQYAIVAERRAQFYCLTDIHYGETHWSGFSYLDVPPGERALSSVSREWLPFFGTGLRLGIGKRLAFSLEAGPGFAFGREEVTFTELTASHTYSYRRSELAFAGKVHLSYAFE